MIPRTLVPRDVRPAAEPAAAPRRLFTLIDARTLVPAELPPGPLEERTQIPAHLPLDVLARRVLVPRDLPVVPLEDEAPRFLMRSRLDDRVVVPPGSRAPEIPVERPPAAGEFPEVLEPDVLTTGEVNLLIEAAARPAREWRFQATLSSVLFHALFVVLVLLQPKIFPYRPPTQEELELANRSLGFIYLPPQVQEVPRIQAEPRPPIPQIHVDPRILRQPGPPPEDLIRPGPRGPESQQMAPERQEPRSTDSQPEASRRAEAGRPQLKLETPKAPDASGSLIAPPTSPGRLLDDSLRAAIQGRGGASSDFGDALPSRPGSGSSGGGGQGYLGGNVQILTPTEGVDFTNYMARVLASVRRNWYAVIPESARLGEKGKTVIQFRILRDGNVPLGEPALMATSGREPLDRAAMSSIRASSPFEPLPPAFSGPYIELRFTFLYNLPLDYQ